MTLVEKRIKLDSKFINSLKTLNPIFPYYNDIYSCLLLIVIYQSFFTNFLQYYINFTPNTNNILLQ